MPKTVMFVKDISLLHLSVPLYLSTGWHTKNDSMGNGFVYDWDSQNVGKVKCFSSECDLTPLWDQYI